MQHLAPFLSAGGQDGFPSSSTREPSYLPLPRPPHQSQKAPTSRFLSSYPMTYHLVGSTSFFPSSEALHVGHTSVPTWALLPGSWLDSETQRPPVREARRGHQPMGWSQQHTPSAGSVLSAELLEHCGDLNKGFVDYTVQACDGAWVAHVYTHTRLADPIAGRCIIPCLSTPSLNPRPKSLALNIFHPGGNIQRERKQQKEIYSKLAS